MYKIISKIVENKDIIGFGLVDDKGQLIKSRYADVLKVIPKGKIINSRITDDRIMIDNYGSNINKYMEINGLPLFSENMLKKDRTLVRCNNEVLKYSIVKHKGLFNQLDNSVYTDIWSDIANNRIDSTIIEERVYLVCRDIVLIKDLAVYRFNLDRNLLKSCISGLWNYYHNRDMYHMGQAYIAEDFVDMGVIKKNSLGNIMKNIHLIMRVYDGYYGLMITEEFNSEFATYDATERKNYDILSKWSRVPTVIVNYCKSDLSKILYNDRER